MLIIIHDFYGVCAFCLYINDIITIEDAKLLEYSDPVDRKKQITGVSSVQQRTERHLFSLF